MNSEPDPFVPENMRGQTAPAPRRMSPELREALGRLPRRDPLQMAALFLAALGLCLIIWFGLFYAEWISMRDPDVISRPLKESEQKDRLLGVIVGVGFFASGSIAAVLRRPFH